MRILPFAAAALLFAGCVEPSDPERHPTGGGTGGATGGSGGMSGDEPDAGGGGEGGEGGDETGGARADSGAGGGKDAAARDARPARDSAEPRDTAEGPRDSGVLRDSAVPRDGGLPRDGALAGDTPALDQGTPPADGPTGGDPEPGRLAGITRFHNQVRAGIPVPALTWDPTLAASAAAYAAECMFEHSGTKGVGENLAAYSPGGDQANAPVDDWASEADDYDHATNKCAAGKVCGHYTQLVWKSSQRVGCAVQACSENSPFGDKFPNWEIWVCQYSPPGNYGGQKPY